MKVKWTIRTSSAVAYATQEYSSTRHINDSTKTQVEDWKRTGYIQVGGSYIPWVAISELHFVEMKESDE